MSDMESPDKETPSSGAPAAADIHFIDQLHQHLDDRQAQGQALTLLLVDCGIVGRVDAVWGYQVGDAVRARIFSTLRTEVLRPGDIICELGRDELACVLSAIDEPQMAMLAAEKMLRTLNAPLWLGDEEVYATPSIGVAISQAKDGNSDSLMLQARRACVAAAGLADHIALYDVKQDVQALHLIESSRLRSAVESDALELVFQPQFDLRYGPIMGMESMLRWSDGDRAMVCMREAIAAAEAGGIVAKLISSMLNRALRNCSEFRQKAGLDLRVSINLPARCLLQDGLPDLIERALRTWALGPVRLVLEIDDIATLQAEPSAQAALQRLHEMGIKLSIDDPHASLASYFWLATMPFKELKIDLSVAPDWMTQPRSEGVLRSLIELARHLKLEIVAMGVPDDAAAKKLAALGCDFIQADFRGPAVDPEEFVTRFAD